MILAISSSILACRTRTEPMSLVQKGLWKGEKLAFFSSLLAFMNGLSFAEMDVTLSKKENSRWKNSCASPDRDATIISTIRSRVGFIGSGYIQKIVSDKTSKVSWRKISYLLACISAVSVRLHVPDDLVAEQLRNLRRLEDEALGVA